MNDEGDNTHVHVEPIDDLIEHLNDEEGDCICGPTIQPVKAEDGSMAWLYIHHSLDNREAHEQETAHD